jgi:uncharacterized damage-inducible protein DinB
MPATALRISRPEAGEYIEYYSTYIDKVPDTDVVALLAKQIDETVSTLSGLSDKEALYRYAPGKWSIKQIVGHMADTERIFVYRALCFARKEKQSLPGFDENDFVNAASFDNRSLADHLAEFRNVRAATLAFLKGLNEEEMKRMGTANGKPLSVRAVAYILAGHEKHHMGVIRERYLKK